MPRLKEATKILLVRPTILSLLDRSREVSTKKINQTKAAIPSTVKMKVKAQYKSTGRGGLNAKSYTLIILNF